MTDNSNLCHQLGTLLDDAKAVDVKSIALGTRAASIADYMIVASGTSSRHIAGMADKLSQFFKKERQLIVAIEGMPQCDWVLIDAGDIIIHLFRPEVRDFYKLEKLWSETLEIVE